MDPKSEGNDTISAVGDENHEKTIAGLLEEAQALAWYVGRHGDVLPAGSDGKNPLYEELLETIENAVAGDAGSRYRKLMAAYAKVTAVTYKERGVNGRTILDTQSNPNSRRFGWLRAPKNRPGLIGLALFILAMLFEALADWRGCVSDPNQLNISVFWYHLIGTLTLFLLPAFWGGIGGCVFLMKRISDKLFALAYEKSRHRGDVTRIVLGSMIGVVTVVLFFPEFGDNLQVGEINLGPRAAAFIAGLGVKPIYAAFESLTEFLARRFKGSGEAK